LNLNCSTGTVWGAGTIWAFQAIAFALVQVFNVQAVFAQPGNGPVPNYSFQQAMDRALSDNPALAATRARLGISDAEIRAAGFHPNPSFLMSYTPAEDLYRLGVQQTIQLGFKRERRISLARAQRDVVRADINVAVLDLRAQLRREQTSQENRIAGKAICRDLLIIKTQLPISNEQWELSYESKIISPNCYDLQCPSGK